MTPVYSRDGSAEFNERLNVTLLRIGDEVEQALGNNLVTVSYTHLTLPTNREV